MYPAAVLKDSVSPEGRRLLSVEVEFPRIVLAETKTHRIVRSSGDDFEEVSWSDGTTTEDMSKNSASSRAIPFKRMCDKIHSDPYIPERFSKQAPGMQGAGWLEGEDHVRAKWAWQAAMRNAVESATVIHDLGAHKQECNRLLEPFAWVTQILTADEIGWNNFFGLRCHKDAAPAFQTIARMVYLLYRRSVPAQLGYGEWHLPYVTSEESAGFRWNPQLMSTKIDVLPDLIQFSAARCAWVSYENHLKESSPEKMKATFDKLMSGDVKHASTVEHQATPMNPHVVYQWAPSNFRGWLQARKIVAGERIDKYNPSDEEITSWGL